MDAEPRRLPKQQRAREKYEAILNASIVVLAREGYAGTNTSNIAKQAGVAVGSLYEYFPNKESIFTAFLDSRIEHILALIQSRAQQARKQFKEGVGQSSKDNLRDWLLLALQVIYENRELLRILVSEIPGVLDLISLKDFDVQLMPLAKFLADGKGLSEAELNVKVYILSNMLYGFVIRSLFSDNPLSTEETADELLKLIVGYASAP